MGRSAVDPEQGMVVWQPSTADVGAHDVILRVSDGRGGVDLQSFQIAVSTNSPPNITSSPVREASAGFPYEYQVRAQDADGDLVQFRLDRAPDGMTIDPATGRWLSLDPIRFFDGPNRYRYAAANPSLLTDPSGLFSGAGCVAGGFGNAVASAIYNIISQADLNECQIVGYAACDGITGCVIGELIASGQGFWIGCAWTILSAFITLLCKELADAICAECEYTKPTSCELITAGVQAVVGCLGAAAEGVEMEGNIKLILTLLGIDIGLGAGLGCAANDMFLN